MVFGQPQDGNDFVSEQVVGGRTVLIRDLINGISKYLPSPASRHLFLVFDVHQSGTEVIVSSSVTCPMEVLGKVSAARTEPTLSRPKLAYLRSGQACRTKALIGTSDQASLPAASWSLDWTVRVRAKFAVTEAPISDVFIQIFKVFIFV